MTPTELKEYLETEIESAQGFRSEKALQYPDDERNQESADSLAKLAASVANIPPAHPLLGTCASLMAKLTDDDGVSLGERQQTFFGRYGFDGPEDCDAEKFLQSYRDLLEDILEQDNLATLAT